MPHRPLLFTGLALCGLSTTLPAQQPQPIGRPTAEFEEPFSRVSGLRELSDGRLIVSDQRDKIVQLVDLRAGTARKISREGAGPGEYALPTALFPMPNDQTLLVDLQNRRFLMIKPDGTPGETISPPQLGTGGPGGVQIGGLVNPRGVDSRGRLYFQDLGIRPGGESPESVAVLRWATGTTSVDTVAWVRGPRTTMATTGGGGSGPQGVRLTVGMGVVWAPLEAWSVSADGMVARVLPDPYRVYWYGPNRRATAGPPVPYAPLRVTEADKEEYRAQQRANPPTMIMMGGGGGGGGGGRAVAPQLPEPTFAETKPPFTGNASVLATPEGEVWVLRTRRAGDKVPVYDVFDGAGRLARKVALSPGSRVVGFGRNSVYVVRTDEDDLEYIQRYARPVQGQP